MGTKLQSKTYFPRFCSTVDLNSAGNGMWALHGDNIVKKGQFNDAFLASSAMDRFIEYEKEKVRQTILNQESIFRNQLQELHRLYRRQRDLMNEVERKDFCKHTVPAETSKTSSVLFPAPSKDGNNTSHVFDFPLVGSTFGRSPASDGGIIQPLLSFKKAKSTCSPLSSRDLHSKDNESLEAKCNNFQRKIFDLELPAKAYTNDEGKQHGERFCAVTGQESFPMERNSDVNGESLRSKLHLKGNHNLADLNEPILEDETSITNFVNNVGGSTCLGEEIKKQDISVSSNSGSWLWAREFSQSCIGGKEARIVIVNKQTESERNGNGQFTYNYIAGKTICGDHDSFSGINGDHSSTVFRSLQVEPRNAYETLRSPFSDHTSTVPQGKRKIFGVEISEGNHNRSVDTSCTPSLHPLNQQAGAMDCGPSYIPPWRKTSSALSQNVAYFPDMPGFHTVKAPFTEKPPNSMIQLSAFSGDKMHVGNNLRSIPSSRSEVSHDNGLCFGTQSGVKQFQGCLNLISHVAIPHRLPSDVGLLHDSASTTIESPHCSSKEIKAKESIYQMNLESLNNHSQHFFNNTKMMKDPTRDFASQTRVVGSGSKKVHGDGSLGDLTNDTQSISQLEVKDSVPEIGVNNGISDLRHQIDLNLSLNEEEVPSAPYVPIAVVKIATTEIDLEDPAILESEMDVSPEVDHLEKKINEIHSKVTLDESREPCQKLAKAAAEAIIDISLSQCQSPEASSPSDYLLLLAEVISSHDDESHENNGTKGLIIGDNASDKETVPEGMDYFEFMTLKLKDAKEEEYYHKPYVIDNMNEEEQKDISVPKRARKGQARRGKQRKDFQRDVLPGLISLSRNEVTEDILTIEEMFKACGDTWQSRLSQRRSTKSGRGRRCSRALGPMETASAVCKPPVQQPTITCREEKLEDRNLTVWGKRTRRLPRQRCSISNHPSVL